MKSYIFDLDGTLFDSMDVWENLDIQFLTRREIPVPFDLKEAMIHMSYPEAALYTIKRFGLKESVWDLINEWNDLALYAYEKTVQLKPYAKEYLLFSHERKIKLAIATSLSEKLYTTALCRHGIKDLFQVICSTENDPQGKKDPGIFLRTAKALKTEPKDCIVFEDILAAIKSAKRIGMTVYGVYDKSSDRDWAEIKRTAHGTLHDFKHAPVIE
jgi:HAD superfamily hydrolase (TIGR01509 family)